MGTLITALSVSHPILCIFSLVVALMVSSTLEELEHKADCNIIILRDHLVFINYISLGNSLSF